MTHPKKETKYVHPPNIGRATKSEPPPPPLLLFLPKDKREGPTSKKSPLPHCVTKTCFGFGKEGDLILIKKNSWRALSSSGEE